MTDTLAPVTFPALGTTAVLLVHDPRVVADARRELEREIDRFDRACSRFRDDSELIALNRAGGRARPVSEVLLAAVDAALDAARVTDGLVDPTVGSAMRVIGYDRDFASIDRDAPELRIDVRAVPGWKVVEVDHARSTIRIPAGVELDLGATAKALCADRAARAIHDTTGAGVLVGLGGDLAVAGPTPDGEWRVRVCDDHAGSDETPGQTVVVAAGGLATSSTTVRRWRRGGRPVHHLVDPTTGEPATVTWRTVSVVASTCLAANIASTAAIILGSAAPDWLAHRQLPSRLVALDGRTLAVGGWPSDKPSDKPTEPCSR